MKAYVRAPYSEACLEELKTLFDEVVYDPWSATGVTFGEDELLAHLLAEAPDVLITELDKVTEKVLEGYGGLKAIGDCRAMPANVDIPACTEHGIPVICTPARNKYAVAELVVSMIVAYERHLIPGVKYLAEGKWIEKTEPYYMFMGHEIRGKKVGIVGYGAVGRVVAGILAAYGCDISFYDPFVDGDCDGFRNVSLEEIFRESDIVTIHAKVTEGTKGLITRELLGMMKPDALFVNAARSVIVDCDALYDMLKEKKIAGAVLDVLDHEPPAGEGDTRFIGMDNVLITPHICGATYEVTDHQSEILNAGIKAWLAGEDLERIVFNKEVLK